MADEETQEEPDAIVWFNLGAEFPSKYASEKAFEELTKRANDHGDASISVWRFISTMREIGPDSEDNLYRMVIIAGNKKEMKAAVDILSKHAAEPWDVPEDVLEGCTRRRIALLEKALATGQKRVRQRASYREEGGRIIKKDGSDEPYRKQDE